MRAVTTMGKLYKKVQRILASEGFFFGIVFLLVLQALWMALSGRYPLPFDEGMHLGTIQLYTHHLSPFLAHQDPGTYGLGAVTRDPSYLYHYLMSFPYRWFAHFVASQTAQIVFLRLFSVAAMAGALFVYRRILRYTGSPDILVNLSLLFFVLIPVVSFTAAQVNYDSFFLLLTGLSIVYALRFTTALRKRNRFDVAAVAWSLIWCFLASLTKFAFLPIFVVIVVWLGGQLYARSRNKQDRRQLLRQLKAGFTRLNRVSLVALAAIFLLSAGLFLERYGGNTVLYGTPTPQCNQILSVQDCKQYAPWYRNYLLAHTHTSQAADAIKHKSLEAKLFSFPRYFVSWLYNMIFTSFYALGPGGLQVGRPLLLPWLLANVTVVAGTIVVIGYYFALRTRMTFTGIFIGLIIFYAGVLCLLTFKDYLRFGSLVAAQGRYLMPILPLGILLILRAADTGLSHYRRLVPLKAVLVAVALLCLLEGGGVLPFIMRSNNSWYWHRPVVIRANNKARQILAPVILERS